MPKPLLICDIAVFLILVAIVVYVFIFSRRLKNNTQNAPSKAHLNALMTIMIIAIVLVVALIIVNTVIGFMIFLK